MPWATAPRFRREEVRCEILPGHILSGGMPLSSSSCGVAGAIHSGWIALKGVLTGHQILVETERGEVLDTQFGQVRQAYDRIRKLRDEAAQAK
jgi:hypothetical protein